jgi:hypothetical protein
MDMSKNEEVCQINPEDCKHRFDGIDAKLDAIHNRLFIGNGQPAVVTRIDRLEQNEKARSKILWILVGAVLVGAANMFLDLMRSKSSVTEPTKQTGKP